MSSEPSQSDAPQSDAPQSDAPQLDVPPLDVPPLDVPPFDAQLPWQLSSNVALRPEPFGALAYHFGNRRLTFLKTPLLVTVVRSLADQPSARAAVVAAGVPEQQRAQYEQALASLANAEVLTCA